MADKLNVMSFFKYFIFNYNDQDLSATERAKATTATLFFGILTLGIGLLIVRLCVYDKDYKKNILRKKCYQTMLRGVSNKDKSIKQWSLEDGDLIDCDTIKKNEEKDNSVEILKKHYDLLPVEKRNQSPNELLISFYHGDGVDIKGRHLSDILLWDNYRKEATHDYIQWLFPLKTSSDFTHDAPILTNALINEMKQDPLVLANIKKSFTTMLDFYGLKYDVFNNKVSFAENFDKRSAVWLTLGNHNFMRITRILNCLEIFGFHSEANAFFNCLTEIKNRHPKICQNPYRYWHNAVRSYAV